MPGIPNKVFYLLCTGLGGNSWDKPLKIWVPDNKGSKSNRPENGFSTI